MVADSLAPDRYNAVRDFLKKHTDPESARRAALAVSDAACEHAADVALGFNASPPSGREVLGELERIGELARSLREALEGMNLTTQAYLEAPSLVHELHQYLGQLALVATGTNARIKRRPVKQAGGRPSQRADRAFVERLAAIWVAATGNQPSRLRRGKSPWQEFVAVALGAAGSRSNAERLARWMIEARTKPPSTA